MLWLMGILMTTQFAFSQVGQVMKIFNGSDAYLMRAGERMALAPEAELEEQDEVHAENCHVVLQIYPSTQLSVPKGSVVKLNKSVIEEGDKLNKSTSLISLIKGFIRLQVTKVEDTEIEQNVEAGNVSFGVRGTEFEVALQDDDVDLDVVEGEVEVKSPDVMTFVPYYVKGGEGFQFNRRKPAFKKKKFRKRMNETGFIPRDQIKRRWQMKKDRIIKRKAVKKAHQDARHELKSEKRQNRMQNRQEKRTERPNRKRR
jgi:hypothetical protein